MTSSAEVKFYTRGSATHLTAIVGIADFAPSDMAAAITVTADGGIWKWFDVSRSQSLPIDLDITGRKTIGFSSTSSTRCDGTKPLVYLGNAAAF